MSEGRRAAPRVRRARLWLTRGRFGVLALVLAVVVGAGAGTGTALATMASPETAPGEASPASGESSAASSAGAPASAPSSSPTRTTPPAPTPTPTPTPTGPVPTAADLAAGILSLDLPTSASGELVVVPGNEPAPDPAAASVRAVRVEVEQGLDVDGAAFAAMVMTTLNDPRGWGAGGRLSFARTDGDAEIRVVLASPDTVDGMCAPLRTQGLYSCGRYGHAALNHTRWVAATDEFPDLTVYRQYVVNHEVGHLLGHPHETCPAAGVLAPIMQQQTIEVAPCLPNAWPYPDGG